MRASKPSSRASASAQGLRVRKASATASRINGASPIPSTCSVWILPPHWLDCSNTVYCTLSPRWSASCCRYHAALSPAIPPPMITTRFVSDFGAGVFMHEFNQSFYVVQRRSGQDAMPQIEDMSRPPAHLIQHGLRARLEFGPGGKERHGVQVALNAHFAAQAIPGGIKINAPVHADHITACVTQEFEHPARPCAKVDNRHARLPRDLNGPPCIGQH